MAKVLCSTGALIGKPNGRDYRLMEQFQKKISCDGYEFIMYSTWYEDIENILFVLGELEKPTLVYHCEKGIGEWISKNGRGDLEEALRRFRINCEMAEKIGAKKLVLHLWNGLISDRFFENNLAAIPKLLEIAVNYGRDLLIENVVCNQSTPQKRLSQIRERYHDISFTYDTKMAAFHGELDLIYEKDYAWLTQGNTIRHYHINDYGGQILEWEKLKPLAPGKGHLDLARFLAFVKASGYEDTFTLEATALEADGHVDFDTLNEGLSFLRRCTH